MPATAEALSTVQGVMDGLMDRGEVRRRMHMDDKEVSRLIRDGILPVVRQDALFRKMWFDAAEVERVAALVRPAPKGLITRHEAMQRLRCTDTTLAALVVSGQLCIVRRQGRQQYYDETVVDRLAAERSATRLLRDDEAWNECERHRDVLLDCWRRKRQQKEVWRYARMTLHLNLSRRQMASWLQAVPEHDAIVHEIRSDQSHQSPFSRMGSPEPLPLGHHGSHWPVRQLTQDSDPKRWAYLEILARQLFSPEAIEQRQRRTMVDSPAILVEVRA